MGRCKEVTAAKLTDDLVVDILSRLTYKDYCRCKCAYKAWSALSSDPHYHKKLPTKVTTGLLYQGRNKSAIPLVSLSQDDEEIDGILADAPHYEHLEIVDCCNGLVLCKYRSNYTTASICRFVVCNPATRQWRMIPDTHPETDDPRYVTVLAFDPSWSPQFYIFNFHLQRHRGSIIGTSKLEIFQSESSSWLVDDKWDSDIIVSRRPHLFLHGMLYAETTGQEVVVFEGLEEMSDGTLPYHWIIDMPSDSSYVGTFTHGCFDKSSGNLHYALPDVDGHSIVVWTLDEYAHGLRAWILKCHLSMTDAFGRDDFVHYDNGGDGGNHQWFWNCDYCIVALDLEKDLVFLSDQRTDKLLSYNICTGILKQIRDGFERCQYYVYVPCYSKLPDQESSV
ncbi:F-box protein At5g07610-like isoform X2 [Lolium rigidum]|uniref:F-box protein At5g07610-like isoform X2 n=1 Tax=Lolium rigidum TaxID=89674 RepID=UPI001F5DD997|nr:F-box protein At5g07610-like isoform X2 [Lolium rigidum]XP_047095591.1 F-box protein At5g07610-like isoform X2 [Lolium rigidum]XP_047095592.1 F-box protein At5g07610-like isoform X2 [Lolium rigidum]